MTDSKSGGSPIRIRKGALLVVWLLACAVLIARAAEIQLLEGRKWRAVAATQHNLEERVPAPRGRILDRSGRELAVTQLRAEVGVATNELRDPEAVAALLVQSLGLDSAVAARVTAQGDRWHTVPGRYPMTKVEALRGVQGVHLLTENRRVHPRNNLAQSVLGRVVDGEGLGGIEQALDSLLQEKAGRRIATRDSRGNAIAGRSVELSAPLSGLDVALSLDADLQAVGEEILEKTVREYEAEAGDLVALDPMTGDLLVLASVRQGSSANLSVHTVTFEPGSTMKPFVAATLLRRGVAALDDSVDTSGSRWRLGRRVITDIGRGGTYSFRQVLLRSSNIGMAKLVVGQSIDAALPDGLSPEDHFTGLRDAGFGMVSGVILPGEARGTLRRPARWSSTSRASLAIGYEIAVTPLQMAMAYGAIANGGRLMRPRLVLEVRSPDGVTLRRTHPTVIREAMPKWVAESLTDVLTDVVDQGTGTRAQLSGFKVAGKSGTARAVRNGAYEPGAYNASFASFFPADDPRMVVFVKFDRPKGRYQGGQIAAPVVRALLEAVVSSKPSSIADQKVLARAQQRSQPGAVPPKPETAASWSRFSGLLEAQTADPQESGVGESPQPPEPRALGSFSLPELHGESMRRAASRLHRMGVRVVVEGHGPVERTSPPAGSRAAPGDTIRIIGSSE